MCSYVSSVENTIWTEKQSIMFEKMRPLTASNESRQVKRFLYNVRVQFGGDDHWPLWPTVPAKPITGRIESQI